MSTTFAAPATPATRWHSTDGPYLRRLRLEALLGAQCSYCGLTREDGANLQFHHHLGRDYRPRELSWSMRLHKYHAEIVAGTLRYLACDQTGRNCHHQERGEPTHATKLYEYDPDTTAHPF